MYSLISPLVKGTLKKTVVANKKMFFKTKTSKFCVSFGKHRQTLHLRTIQLRFYGMTYKNINPVMDMLHLIVIHTMLPNRFEVDVVLHIE